MTKAEVITMINNVANVHGFSFESNSWYEIKDENCSNLNDSWVGFRVYDMEDAEYDFDNRKITAGFRIAATVRRMGGETSPEELLEASLQIQRAATMVKQFELMDLTYTQTY